MVGSMGGATAAADGFDAADSFERVDGGATTPMEMTYFSAVSTLISSSMTSLLGSIRKKPEVGLGVVGTYTLT
jgi:hypothetical protein